MSEKKGEKKSEKEVDVEEEQKVESLEAELFTPDQLGEEYKLCVTKGKRKGQCVTTTLGNAMVSVLVRKAVEDDNTNRELDLDMTMGVLGFIVDYMNNVSKGVALKPLEQPLRSTNIQEIVTPDEWKFLERTKIMTAGNKYNKRMYDLINAANYLDIKHLLYLLCGSVAAKIKGKPFDEVKKILATPGKASAAAAEKEGAASAAKSEKKKREEKKAAPLGLEEEEDDDDEAGSDTASAGKPKRKQWVAPGSPKVDPYPKVGVDVGVATGVSRSPKTSPRSSPKTSPRAGGSASKGAAQSPKKASPRSGGGAKSKSSSKPAPKSPAKKAGKKG